MVLKGCHSKADEPIIIKNCHVVIEKLPNAVKPQLFPKQPLDLITKIVLNHCQDQHPPTVCRLEPVPELQVTVHTLLRSAHTKQQQQPVKLLPHQFGPPDSQAHQKQEPSQQPALHHHVQGHQLLQGLRQWLGLIPSQRASRTTFHERALLTCASVINWISGRVGIQRESYVGDRIRAY